MAPRVPLQHAVDGLPDVVRAAVQTGVRPGGRVDVPDELGPPPVGFCSSRHWGSAESARDVCGGCLSAVGFFRGDRLSLGGLRDTGEEGAQLVGVLVAQIGEEPRFGGGQAVSYLLEPGASGVGDKDLACTSVAGSGRRVMSSCASRSSSR